MATMASNPKPKLDVRSFPRPPLLERTDRRIQIKWHGWVITDTREAYWVLETDHAPSERASPAVTHRWHVSGLLTIWERAAYYVPPAAVIFPIARTKLSTVCKWKGTATYFSLMSTISRDDVVKTRIWSYEAPTNAYEPIRGYLAFHAGPWDCYVDGEQVTPELGLHGGWVTSDIGGGVFDAQRDENINPALR